MADERAIEVAVHHADGASAVSSAGNGERRMSTPPVESIVLSLRARLGQGSDVAVIAAEVEAELSTYVNARVTQFVPVLVESRVWERLRRRGSA